MFTIEIQLPDAASFKRAGAERTFALKGLDASIIAELVVHGLTQKVGDAAAGASAQAYGEGWDDLTREQKKAWADDPKNAASIEAGGIAAMQKVHDALMAGDWGVKRAAAGGLSGIEKAAFQMFVDAQPWGKKIKADAKREQMQPAWDAMADDEKVMWLNEAQDEADRLKAAEERRARLAAKVGTIKLG